MINNITILLLKLLIKCPYPPLILFTAMWIDAFYDLDNLKLNYNKNIVSVG